jgi:hypothetical protein
MGQEDFILVSPFFPLNLNLIVVKTVVIFFSSENTGKLAIRLF